jgi:hypothetical protein
MDESMVIKIVNNRLKDCINNEIYEAVTAEVDNRRKEIKTIASKEEAMDFIEKQKELIKENERVLSNWREQQEKAGKTSAFLALGVAVSLVGITAMTIYSRMADSSAMDKFI